jgi:hypothetical protein
MVALAETAQGGEEASPQSDKAWSINVQEVITYLSHDNSS